MTLRELTVKERILLHLFDYNRFADEYEVPLGVAQEGIAQVVGIRVHHVSQYIRPLISKGAVEERTSHIRHKPRKRKAYFLTSRGRFQAASLRSTLLKEEVPFKARSGQVREIPFSQAYQEHRRGSTLLGLVGELASLGYISEAVEGGEPQLADFTQEAPEVVGFYGRTEELEKVLQALQEVPLVVVTGMAGVGKTTLGSKICDELRGQLSLFWRQVRPWDTAMDLLSRLAIFLKSLGRSELHGSLTGPGPKDLSRTEELLAADLAGVDSILILDDVHNSSEDAQAFFSILLRVLKLQRRTSALLLSRTVPDFYSRREVAVEGSVLEVPLRGLGQESSRSLLEDAGIAKPLLDGLVKVGGGNPLFLKLLTSAGPEVVSEERWSTLEAYISEEIETSLEETERSCLELASFYQFPIPPEALLLEGGVRRRMLIGLHRKGLLNRVDPERFLLHDSLRNYFRNSLSHERTKALVRRVVSWLREKAQELAKDGRPEEGITYMGNAVAVEIDTERKSSSLELLGRLRRQVGDFPGAIEAYRSAMREAEDATVKPRLHRKIAGCLDAQGYLEEAEREIERGLELLPSEPSLEVGWLLAQRAGVAFNRQDFDRCYEEVERVLSWMPALPPDPGLSGKLANLMALIHLEDPSRGDPALAKANLEEAISAFQATGNQRGLSVAYTNLGIAVLHMGRFEEALEHFDRSAAVAEKAGDIPCMEAALFSKAFCLMDGLGDYGAAESLYRETYKMAKETHQRRKLVWHYRYFADLYRRQGRHEEARESLDYFLTSSGGMINVETRIRNLGLMVRICILCGDLEAARENLSKAVNLAGEAPSGIADHIIHWATGAVEAFQGDARKAEAHFQRALELARPGESGEFLLEYGGFLSGRGETQPAREVLLQACKELGKISKPLERAALKELQTLESSGHA